MSTTLLITYAPADEQFALLLQSRLTLAGYSVHFVRDGDQRLDATLRRALALLVLISPASQSSEPVMRVATLARQHNARLVPLLIEFMPGLPWYVDGLDVEDFTTEFETAFERLLRALPAPQRGETFGTARDAYLQRATLRSLHTIDAYRRSIELFLTFLADRSLPTVLPIQAYRFTLPDEIPLTALSEQDTPILLHFAQWLLSPSSGRKGDKRPYKPTTVELRLAGVQNWLQFLDDYGWLPPDFKLARSIRMVRDELRTRPQRSGPPEPPDNIEEVIYYYDTQQPPAHLRKPNVDPERLERWQLTRQRNKALLHCLAETGGRISEILSLNISDFPPRHLNKDDVVRVQVTGKGGHNYYLRFYDSLPALKAYLTARGVKLRATSSGEVPLFVSHDPRYDGNRMSRVVAWRVVQRAARALGLPNITPHDFRHWRATQLINAGHPLDVVQDYLGHRSVETTRAYYAHTDPLRVDDAARHTGLPDQEDEEE